MKHVSWADRARQVIGKVMQANPGVEGAELKKLLSAAYPFGERAYHPYKMWLKEVKKAVEGRQFRKPTAQRLTEDLPGQGLLL